MLHCLRIELPSLPQSGSTSWAEDSRKGEIERGNPHGLVEGRGGADDVSARDPFEHDGSLDLGSEYEVSSRGGFEGGLALSQLARGSSGVGDEVAEGVSLNEIVSACSIEGDPDGSAAHGDMGIDGWKRNRDVDGLEVSCPPPQDMMEFLRGMSWWEEGMIEAAERTRRKQKAP